MNLARFSKVQESNEYTLYKWVPTFRNLPTSSLRMYDINKDLKYVIFVASLALSQVKGKATITFYGKGGSVFTLVPTVNMKELLNPKVILRLSSVLQDEQCFWFDIPEMFPINSTSKYADYGLGQIIVVSEDKLSTPLIGLSSLNSVIEYNCSERYDEVVLDSDYCLFENALLKLRAFNHFMGEVTFDTYVDSFGIDSTFDRVVPTLESDISEKYCLQKLSVILEHPEVSNWDWDWIEKFRYMLCGLNISNFDDRYPIEYDVVKVGNNYQLMYYIYKDKGLGGGIARRCL